MNKDKNIVAAELVSVKDKVSLLDAIAFPLAGDNIAGLAGALVGASLVPSKVIFNWRVLYEDGTYGKLRLNGDDPRNNLLMEMPYLPDYEAYMESEHNMTEEMHEEALSAQDETAPRNVGASNNEHAPEAGGGAEIGAGYYIFGENFPEGTFDLSVASGKGSLTMFDKDGSQNFMWLAQYDGAMGFNGLSSARYKAFQIEGSVQVFVRRAAMVQI